MIEGLQSFQNVFKIPELKRRVLITAGLLVAYRLGAHVPTPGIDGHALSALRLATAYSVLPPWGRKPRLGMRR